MSSPFRIFRRHQKVMMVVLVGLSMLSFVVCGSIQDATDLSGPLLVALLAAAVGSITWLMGLNNKKSTEYGAYGLLIGACVGLVLVWNFSAPPAISMKGGNISREELDTLQDRRILANTFVQAVVARLNDANPTTPIQQFAFGNSDPQSLAFGEILRREADRMGIVGSQETVSNFLMAITTPRGGGDTLITSGVMQSVCREIGASEQAVYEALQDEWRIRQVQIALSGGEIIPPETYWDAHQKLNVQQDMELAILPASEFVDEDESVEPSDSELEEFFSEYRENFPNFTAEGQPEEGRPGFGQPRRAQFAYIEGTADDYLDQVTVTPAEIDAEYIRRYPPPVDEDAASRTPGSTVPARPPGTDPFPDGPALPPPLSTNDAPTGDAPIDPATTTPESTEAPDPESGDSADQPAVDTPETESATDDAEGTEAAAPETEESSESTPDATESAEEPPTDSSCDDPVVDNAAETADESTETPSADDGSESTETDTQADISAGDDPAAATDPVDPGDPATETPDTETPATTDDATTIDPATTDITETETPAEPAPFTLSESEDPPPPPLPGETGEAVVIGPPPLTDELRAEIEEYLRLIKADALLQEDLESFAIAFEKQIRQRAVLPPESDDHMSLADAVESARTLATEEESDQDPERFEFYFAQTPLLSSTELRDSKDHTFGSAVEMSSNGTSRPISSAIFQDFEDLHRPVLCESPTQASPLDVAPPPPQSRFVVWKIADLNAYAPETLADDREGMEQKIREQVVESWQLFKARETVEARAAELVEMAKAGTEPFSTVFADTKLIGDDGLSLDTTETQHMSWYRQSSAAGANALQQPPPEMNSIPGLPDVPVGQNFMHTVFREMEVGETRAVWNADYTYLFVVRVKKRVPSTPEEWNGSRAAFLADLPDALRFANFGLPMPVLQLAEGERQQHMSRGVDLFEEYDVQFADELSQ